MNIVFRVDSSSQMGIGHLMRCLTLADGLQENGCQIVFICRELKGSITDLIKYKILILSSNDTFQSNDLYLSWLGATQEQDAEQTIEVIPKNTDILIVDNYALDEEWHKKLSQHSKKIMVIDDLAEKKFDCDILLNQNLGRQKENYQGKVPIGCRLLLGCDYALLRLEFVTLRVQALKKRRNTTEIKNILISMGGSDKNNVTYDVLQQIDGDFNIVVVLGSASIHQEMIKDYVQDKNIEVIVNSKNMAELILKADLAIGAGGATSWERCCLGLPTLLYVLSENQRKTAENLEQLGAVMIVRNLENDFQALVNGFSLWQFMSSKSQSICDGLGAEKVVAYLGSLQK